MDLEVNLRKLKYYINESVISKENAIESKKKEYLKQTMKMKDLKLNALENHIAAEGDLSRTITKTIHHLNELTLKRELENQIELKKVKLNEKKAEDVIDSLEAKLKDRAYFRELEENKCEKVSNKDFEFMKHQENYKMLNTKIEEERAAALSAADARCVLLKELQNEYEHLQAERKQLEKGCIEIDLRSSLQKDMLKKEELRILREEDQIIRKEQEDEEKALKNKYIKLQEQENILKGREEQLRLKEESKALENVRVSEYLRLLTELLAEEEGLHRLRTEVANRKRREHFVIAQKILEERTRRRKKIAIEKDFVNKKEKELSTLRDSILEEEERRLLLQHLPHLGPLLSSYVVRKLACL